MDRSSISWHESCHKTEVHRAMSRSFFRLFVNRAENLFALQAEVDKFDVEGGARWLLGADEKLFPSRSADADFARSHCLFENGGEILARFGVAVGLHANLPHGFHKRTSRD